MQTPSADERPRSVQNRLSPESIARYVQGAPAESRQFDFFVGVWDCDVSMHAGDGSVALELGGRWEARWTHERRLLVDDLSLFLPDGTEVVGWVNLRTYCAETGCWEIIGQRALTPVAPVRTTGHWREGEMHLAFETPEADATLENHVRFCEIGRDSWYWHWSYRRRGAEDDSAWHRLATIRAKRAVGSDQR